MLSESVAGYAGMRSMQTLKVLVKVCSIILPRHIVHARGRIALEREE
jgi:hypothetical protein